MGHHSELVRGAAEVLLPPAGGAGVAGAGGIIDLTENRPGKPVEIHQQVHDAVELLLACSLIQLLIDRHVVRNVYAAFPCTASTASDWPPSHGGTRAAAARGRRPSAVQRLGIAFGAIVAEQHGTSRSSSVGDDLECIGHVIRMFLFNHFQIAAPRPRPNSYGYVAPSTAAK